MAVAPRTIVLFVVVILGALLALSAAYAVRDLLVQLVVAVVLALAAEPLVRAFERRGLSRGAAVGVSFGLFLLALLVFVYLLVKPLAHETQRLVHDSPALLDQLTHGRGRLGFLERKFEIVERVQSAVASGKLSAAAGPAWSVIGGAVHTGSAIVFVLFLMLFVQLGGRQWYESLVSLVPETARPRARRTGSGIAEAVGGYVSGNLFISVIAGTTATVVLYATSVPYPIALGLLVGILDLIPLVGATLGTIVVAAVALATQGWVTAAIVVVALILYQQVENHVLQQLVYHRTVKLSPLAIALSVAAGAELGGVVGALLGIPFAGAVKVVSTELLAWHRERDVPPVTTERSSDV
ncbi:MAG TPA: AI-2E family transporter [Gaiellaceae bacterium]|nr:AI-2E family transporter [Gaiellaceae bacterium]